MSEETRKYELMLMLFPDLGEKQTEEELTEFRSLVTSLGGKIFNEDIWGNRELAYRIKKQDHGYYAVFNMDFPPAHISELEKTLNISQAVMRFLLITTPEDYEMKTLAQYQAEAAAAAKEEEEEKAKKQAKKAPAKKAAPKKPAAKKEEKKVDVEAKISSIVDDPDISL